MYKVKSTFFQLHLWHTDLLTNKPLSNNFSPLDDFPDLPAKRDGCYNCYLITFSKKYHKREEVFLKKPDLLKISSLNGNLKNSLSYLPQTSFWSILYCCIVNCYWLACQENIDWSTNQSINQSRSFVVFLKTGRMNCGVIADIGEVKNNNYVSMEWADVSNSQGQKRNPQKSIDPKGYVVKI